MLELRLLGAFEAALAGDTGASLPAQPKRAALLAYLALASQTGLVRRDQLLALFWPDADETRAGRALNQALHHLRGVLGPDVLITRGDDEVGVDRTRLECDVVRARTLVAADRLEDALAIYRGELLPGFHAHASNDFEDWLERERLAIRAEMIDAAIALSTRAHDENNIAAALHWARRALDLAPLDETCARQLIGLLVEDGNAAAARDQLDRFTERMRRDLDISPSPRTMGLLDDAAVRTAALPPRLVGSHSAIANGERRPEGEQQENEREREHGRELEREKKETQELQRQRGRARWRRPTLAVIASAIAAVGLLTAAAAVTTRAGGLGPSFSALALPHRAAARPIILLADLAGPPADTALGDIVTQLLLSGLQDSRAARAVWSGELGAALARMKLPPSAAVRGRIARELAVREGFGAVLEGTVHSAGSGLLVHVSLVDPGTGHPFFTEAVPAADATALTHVVDGLVRTVRRRIGDSRDAIARARPLEQVTTPSLEALRAYTEASRLGRFEDARPRALLERAVAIDTAFAAAYRRLGIMAAWRWQSDTASQLLAKALRHADRASARERASSEAMVYTHGRFFDGARALTAWETMLGQDSTDGAALLNAAWLLGTQRRFAAAERAHARAITMGDSMGQTVFMSLARDRFALGKTSEAWRTLDAGIRRNPRSLILTFRARAYLVASRLDSAEADLRRALDSSPDADGDEHRWVVAVLRASMARQAGRLARARAYDADAAHYARLIGNAGLELLARLGAIHDAAYVLSTPLVARGELPALRRLAESVAGANRPIPALAEAFAEMGDPATATSVLREYERGIRAGEWREGEPQRHRAWAQIALAEGRPRDAVRELRAADVGICVTCMLPLLSMAYERAGQPDSAIAAGERYLAILDPSASELDGLHRPVLHRRLAELYLRLGNRARAERHLRAFITMWRDADAELQPQVAAARRQLQNLGRTRLD